VREVRRSFEILAEAARGLHGERDRSRLLTWAVDAARRITGADAVGVCLLPRDGEPEWAVDGVYELQAVGDPRTLAPLRMACQGDGMVRLQLDGPPDIEALPLVAYLPEVAAVVAAPVLQGDGVPHGVLLLAGRTPDLADEEVAQWVEVVAAHLGTALDNQARFAALQQARSLQRELVDQLQEAVRPPIPTVSNTELGVSYHPADPGAPTGGDLYDWIVLPDGTLHLVVVDVMGKGVAATKDALSVTHTLRLLALDGCPLADLVRRTDTILTGHSPDLVATLVVAHYDTASGELKVAGAGHPPPLLVHEGRAEELKAPGVPIGWPGAGSHEVLVVQLERSDTVLFYTDGLIEATKDVVVGLDDLVRYAEETNTYPAAQQARVLVERALAGAARHDDSLALVLRRRTPPAQTVVPLGRFEYHLSPAPATIPLARNLLREWLVRVPVDESEAHDLLLVATELTANAVEHAQWTAGGVTLRAWVEDADVIVEVEDDGGTLVAPVHDDEPPDPEAERGRGLWLVQALADEVVHETSEGRSVVRARARNTSPRSR
jgi:serine phosphatase RsbU (regulator of sigma subunit)/anti-sigma regulatory factor (Ser/Thr protein kinase)